jgi:hypothetical protein
MIAPARRTAGNRNGADAPGFKTGKRPFRVSVSSISARTYRIFFLRSSGNFSKGFIVFINPNVFFDKGHGAVFTRLWDKYFNTVKPNFEYRESPVIVNRKQGCWKCPQDNLSQSDILKKFIKLIMVITSTETII